ETLRSQNRPEVDELNPARIEFLGIEEAELGQVPQGLRGRLGQRVEVEHPLTGRGGVEANLLSEDRLARAGRAGENDDRALGKTPVKELIEVTHPRLDARDLVLLLHDFAPAPASLLGSGGPPCDPLSSDTASAGATFKSSA